MEEENILKMVMEKQSWEDIIYSIVTLENLNPWDIDITKLTDSFLNYIEKMKMLDFRIPAKVVVVAALLLKLKCEIFSPFEKSSGSAFYGQEFDEELLRLKEQATNLELKSPVKRRPKRRVTLDELIDALKKAMKVKEKKESIRNRLGRKIRNNLATDEIDIEIRINNLMSEIDTFLLKLKSDKVEFSKIVHEWERENIINNFLPLLHLASRGKVGTEQKEFFKEIYIKKKS